MVVAISTLLILSESNTMTFYLTVLASSTLSIFSWIIYQLYFSPLSRFPGPFWAKVNPFWHAYQISSGQRRDTFVKLHRHYGDLVRVGVNDISVCNIAGQYDLHKHGVTLVKTVGYNVLRPDTRYSSVANEQDKKIHGRLRCQIRPAFSIHALEGMETYIKANITAFCDGIKRFGKNGENSLDLSEWNTFLTFDILGDLCFSNSYKMLETGIKSPVIDAVKTSVQIAGTFFFLPKFLFLIPYTIPKQLVRQRRLLVQESYRRVVERLSIKSTRRDVFYYALKNIQSEGREEDIQGSLHSIMQTMLSAGADSTSAAITTAMYHLYKNPKVLAKLRQEITDNFNTIADINSSTLASLTYLNAIIEETLRMAPPIAGELPRITVEPETIVCGYKFPKGVTLSVFLPGLSRDKRYFTDPDSFIPERWFEEGYKRDQSLGAKAFQPFSLGPRVCLGINMAYMVIRLTLAHWVLEFDAELENPLYIYEPKDHGFFASRPELFMKVRPRECSMHL